MDVLLLLSALVAGMLAPLQAALNSKVGRAVGDPFYAALISFAVGTAALFFYVLITGLNFSSIRHTRDLHWSVWSAGFLGAFYVTATIILTPRLGVALTFALVVAGQLIMAVFLDHFGLLGVPVQSFSWQRMTGIAFITAGVFLLRKF